MPEMGVPPYQTFMRPLLAFGVDGQKKNIRAAIDAIADKLYLTADDRQQLLPSGKQTLLANRVHWARTYRLANPTVSSSWSALQKPTTYESSKN
jgi:restriction endonuclease Mrr